MRPLSPAPAPLPGAPTLLQRLPGAAEAVLPVRLPTAARAARAGAQRDRDAAGRAAPEADGAGYAPLARVSIAAVGIVTSGSRCSRSPHESSLQTDAQWQVSSLHPCTAMPGPHRAPHRARPPWAPREARATLARAATTGRLGSASACMAQRRRVREQLGPLGGRNEEPTRPQQYGRRLSRRHRHALRCG